MGSSQLFSHIRKPFIIGLVYKGPESALIEADGCFLDMSTASLMLNLDMPL